MSVLADSQRRAAAEDERYLRQITVLEELLRIVKARREQLSVRTIAARIERHPRTVYRREQALREMLEVIELAGQRRRT